MALNKGKHVVEELDGRRCTVVEKSIAAERAEFLRKLLEHNGFEVVTTRDQESGSLTLGVTDLVFNPVIEVYKRRLVSFTGKRVTPAYWLQESMAETEAEVFYWNFLP